MTAYLIVRAVVPEVDRETFDQWYENIHLPEALNAFSAVSACRGWSYDDPNVHVAFYEFPGINEATAIGGSKAMKSMRADFDRTWQDRISRSREVIEIKQEIQA